MTFWDLADLRLSLFRPGIMSRAEMGKNLAMAFMEIAQGNEDTGHEHAFDQCGVVLAGKIEMFVGAERRVLLPETAYFIPSGVRHGWKTLDIPAQVLDISVKQS